MASPQTTTLAPARLFGLIGWLGYAPGDSKPPVSPLNSAQGAWQTWIPGWKKKVRNQRIGRFSVYCETLAHY